MADSKRQLKPPQTYFIWTIGCQMNEADSRALASQLEAVGLSPAPAVEAADLVVLNTCVVRQQAEDKVYGRLNSLGSPKRRRPGQILCVMGCLVGVKDNPQLQERFPFVDVFLPPSEPGPLLDFLAGHGLIDPGAAAESGDRSIRDRIQNAELLLPMAERGRQVTAFVPVVLGCSHACSFCIIPSRRGRERSRPQGEILEEIRSLAGQGIREVMLLGQIVDRYGHDLEGRSLAGLLRQVHRIDDIQRIRFLTSHPAYMTDELIDTVAELPRICPHFEVPIQAGNDDVLERMRRGYTVAAYRGLIRRIRERIPDAAINTDLIVGFCGETEPQFNDTCRVIEEIQFDKVHIARYSTRPGTPAARRYEDDVTDDEKERRRRVIDARQQEILQTKNNQWLGRDVEVLVEGRQKGRWRGRTPQNRLVFFADDRELAGELVRVRVEIAGPYSLVGTAVDAASELITERTENTTS